MAEPAQPKQKILIVDDNPQNVRILLEALKQDCQIVAANGGASALRLANADQPPDLILLDVMMPEIDGYEVCRRLKSNERTKDIPVVFITALGEEENEVQGLSLGAVDYIIKPIIPTLVRARVRNHLELKSHRDNLAQLVAERTGQLEQALGQLRDASLDTIHRLSRAAEYKDEETGAHILRMSNYSASVARRMGLSSEQVENILYAAPMHDVGKIGIPDHILLKPGKLNPDEWEIMKQHAPFGANILDGSEEGFLGLAHIIAFCHHEKWNGTGYPRGLKGTDIPLAARIVAIADVFDALDSKRPYKEAFPLEKSLGIIQESKGAHFDPQVVDAFFAVQEEIMVIRDRYRDQGESRLWQLARN